MLSYRHAVPEDIAACIEIRGKTRENAIPVERLAAHGITRESWAREVVEGTLPGYVCTDGDQVVGYCFGERGTGEIVVLALLPEYENKGIGKALLTRMVAHLAGLGFDRMFLGCSADPHSRSYGFYRHLGWRSTNTIDAHQDEVLEYFPMRLSGHA